MKYPVNTWLPPPYSDSIVLIDGNHVAFTEFTRGFTEATEEKLGNDRVRIIPMNFLVSFYGLARESSFIIAVITRFTNQFCKYNLNLK